MFEVIIVVVALFTISPLLVGLACNIYRTGQMIGNPSRFKLWYD